MAHPVLAHDQSTYKMHCPLSTPAKKQSLHVDRMTSVLRAIESLTTVLALQFNSFHKIILSFSLEFSVISRRPSWVCCSGQPLITL